jgi:hypothetical protein
MGLTTLLRACAAAVLLLATAEPALAAGSAPQPDDGTVPRTFPSGLPPIKWLVIFLYCPVCRLPKTDSWRH